jgi:hypothetical protein
LREGACRGCKLGYATGERDLSKAKCRIKVCCMGKGHTSCADCAEYATCAIVQEFFKKNGYKYAKYKQAIDFIRGNGYTRFIELADDWKCQYGRLERES